MKKKLWISTILTMLALSLMACARIPSLLASSGQASPVQGGGGGSIVFDEQVTQGVVVLGTGMVSAEPEVAQVTFGVELQGKDPAAIVNEGAQKIDLAIAAVQKLGEQSDIRTTNYSLWVENIHDQETGRATGEVVYHLSHQVQATLHDLDRVGELLSAVAGAGVNTIAGVTFTVDNPQALVEQARQKALQDANAKAQQMAEGLGIALDKPILVTEEGGGYGYPEEPRAEWGMGGGGNGMTVATVPGITPGTFSVSVSVRVVYAIR
jgi:uncharacterized protein YggE